MTDKVAKRINNVEFETPFRLDKDGNVIPVGGVYAPEVTTDEATDVYVSDGNWGTLSGMTGQYGYDGVILHPSEYVGEGIAKRLMELCEDSPQVFVIVEVRDDEEPDVPVGWAILQRLA